MALLVGTGAGAMAQTATLQDDGQECVEVQASENETTGNNSCTIMLYYPDGSVASSVKVSTLVGGGVGCMGGRDFYTNDKGKATLFWSEGCYLKKIYVKGCSYDADYFKDDGNYTITLNPK